MSWSLAEGWLGGGEGSVAGRYVCSVCLVEPCEAFVDWLAGWLAGWVVGLFVSGHSAVGVSSLLVTVSQCYVKTVYDGWWLVMWYTKYN